VINHKGSNYFIRDLVANKIEEVHISRLRPYYYNPEHTGVMDPYSVALRDHGLDEVEAVLEHRGHRNRKRNMKFKVRWVGSAETTWEPWDSIYNNAELHKYLDANFMRSLIPNAFKNYTADNQPTLGKRRAKNLR
jgi:hypothetical protein